jgi:hypothetical protein
MIVTATIVARLISPSDAIITNANVPILGVGAGGRALIGRLSAKFA